MKIGLAMLIMIPALTMADGGPPAHGMMGVVVNERAGSATDKALDHQRRSVPANSSEISAPVYVDSQRRIAESFRSQIPDTFGPQTRGSE